MDWFLSARREARDGDPPSFYERHELDQQRAYQIICLMVGSDPARFKALADRTELPEDRRRTCAWDYKTASDPGLACWRRIAAPRTSRKRPSR